MGACTQKSKNGSRVEYLPFFSEASFTPNWLDPSDPLLENFHQIPPFEMINQDGETITEKTFEGKIYVVDFFFTSCPGICSKMTENMGVVQEAFMDDDEVLLMSHSVTPRKDSVSVLKAYADARNVVSGKWHLVTGDQKEIYSLGRKQYFVEEDLGLQKKENEFLHTENFILVDHKRRIRGIYNGLTKVSIQQLIEDIKSLKQEMKSSQSLV
ncbi:MAG: SCO family protein [Bacteroidia bacterium]|nr:SCO family protein [Bacteroidia bacterium]